MLDFLMLALGIDPGTATVGYGFVRELNDGSLQAVKYGVITTSPSLRMAERLRQIFDELTVLIEHYQPDRAAVIKALDGMNLAWGDVREGAETLQLPTVKHRGTITSVDDRAGGQRPVVQSPYRFSTATSGARGGSPRQGEHNAEVLADWLGFDRKSIDALRDIGRASGLTQGTIYNYVR